MDATGVNRLRAIWRKRAAGALGLACFALVVVVVVGGAHLARLGTAAPRLGAAFCIAGALLAWAGLAWRAQRDFRDDRRSLKRILLPTDRDLGERALRALATIDRAMSDPSVGDPRLARLHFERLLGKASVDSVEGAATRHASLWRGVGLALLLAGLFAVFLSPLRLIEGLDVLVARHGRAPVELNYLRYPRVTAQPPSYTRASERTLVLGATVALPKGTVITIRGMPRYEERTLVVSDGEHDVPFVSDGAGGLVARYSVERTSRLRVAARFGDVLIEEEDALDVAAIVDTAPLVVLDEAPKRVELADVDRIALRWSARDDYGLRQVDLVLRSGAHEDRRVLGKFDGESARERGGYSLSSRDSFLRRAFLPVSLTIEARDNDPIDGSKWGRSEAIVVVPPTVGEPEAERYRALSTIRGALVDLVGWYGTASTNGERPATTETNERVRAIRSEAAKVLEGTYGGLSVPRGVQSFALGQLGRLAPGGRVAALDDFEDVALALDAALRSFGARDAEVVAKRLGDVTEEVATGARLARDTEQRTGGLERLDVALVALDQGIEWLALLGPLGRDLSGVARGDFGRIERSRKADDLTHAELAALHLAARLRQPNPSFGSSGGRGGVESGTGQGSPSPGEGAPPSNADNAFDQLAEQIRELAREHGDALSGVEQVLEQAAQGEELGALREEARQRARIVREAVDELPPPGDEPGSRRAAEALAREHANAMAHAMEKLDLADALESGKAAMSSLDDAGKRQGFGSVTEAELDEIRDSVQKQVDWVEQMADRLRRNAEERAREALSRAGDKERQLAERADRLAERGESGETALPGEVSERLERARDVMRQAAQALAQGRGREGADRQREAQRLLEQSDTGKTKEPEEERERETPSPSEGRSSGQDIAIGGDVPPENEQAKAEEFRRRVLRGLAEQKSDRLSPAVKRYAEGLLR